MSHRRQPQDAPKRRRHTFDNKEGQSNPIVSKQAFVFLCLFDGFRIPSIRRMTRKPRTICFEPLINYDPYLSSPATKSAIDGRYESLLNVKCSSFIDPSTNQVSSLINRTLSRPLNERLIIHYFGQGSIKPSKTGQLFFFDSNHHSYRGLNISKVIGSVSAASSSKILAPVALILDVNGAGALIPELNHLVESGSADLIAFLSCDDQETLPSAPSLPNDVLSSSILFPSKMAVWFHAWRSSFNAKEVSLIFTQSPIGDFEKYTEVSTNESFLSFLNSVIDSIAFSKLDQISYEKYIFEDPSLATITRGFILAQRILRYHNIHAKSVPALPDFSDSELWAYLDLVLDLTFSEDNYSFSISQAAFDQLTLTFDNFPNFQVIPIFCHFLTVPKYCDKTQKILFDSVDKQVRLIPLSFNTIAIRVLLTQANTSILNPSIITFLIISKLVFFNELSITDMRLFMQIVLSSNYSTRSQPVIGAAILSATCALNNLSALTATQRESLLYLCTKNSVEGAPFSPLLYSMIMHAKFDLISSSSVNFDQTEKADEPNFEVEKFVKQSFLCSDQLSFDKSSSPIWPNSNEAEIEKINNDTNFAATFIPLLTNPRYDIRAAAVHALGFTKELAAIDPLINSFVKDESSLVQFEAAVSLNLFLNQFSDTIGCGKKINDKSPGSSENFDENMKKINDIIAAARKIADEETKKSEKIKIVDSSANSGNPPLYLLDVAQSLLEAARNIGNNTNKNNEAINSTILKSKIPELFRKSITQPGLLDRYNSNFFEVD